MYSGRIYFLRFYELAFNAKFSLKNSKYDCDFVNERKTEENKSLFYGWIEFHCIDMLYLSILHLMGVWVVSLGCCEWC